MSLIKLLEKYERVLPLLPELGFETWGGNHDALFKARWTITPRILERFADYYIGGIGLESGVDFPIFSAEIKSSMDAGVLLPRPTTQEEFARLETVVTGLFKHIRHLFSFSCVSDEEKRALLRADGNVGGPYTSVIVQDENVDVTPHTLQTCIRYPQLISLLGHRPASVLEIGGGHGRFVRDIGKVSPDTRIFYCDLPLNMLLAARYLSACFPGELALVWEAHDQLDPDKRFNIVAPWRLGDIPEGIEVCCNFLSFHHMTETNVDFYVEHLMNRSVKNVFSYNRDFPLHKGEASLPNTLLHKAYHEIDSAPGTIHKALRMFPDGRREVQGYDIKFSLIRRNEAN